MADVKVRIELKPNVESEMLGDIQNQVNSVGSSENLANVSIKANSIGFFQNIPEKELSEGFNGLSFAQPLIINEQGYLDNQDGLGGVLADEENPVEFVWGAVGTQLDPKEYHVKLVFTNSENLNSIIVYGNEETNQFQIFGKVFV